MAAEITLILDGSRGIYIPQGFAERFGHWLGEWKNVNQDDIDTLLEGPDHEWYWEAWQNVVDNAEYMGADGVKYSLYQDGDVWLVPEGTRFPSDDDWEDYVDDASQRQIDDFNQAYQSHL